ncbi:MAG: hypothetical protein ACYTEZ_09145 [Planctomycetota bacterium]
MSAERIDILEVLRRARRSAGDQRKVFLALYGLLLLVPLLFAIVAAGRSLLFAGFGRELQVTFLRPVAATTDLFEAALAEGRWGLMVAVLLCGWVAGAVVGSFFGLAVTRMAAIELTCERRAEVKEALRFARSHWHWAFLTPFCLLFGAVVLFAMAAGVMTLGRITDYFLVVAAPAAFVFSLTGVVLLLGLMSGGLLAWPTIATEWSDAFDAITRVYGYSFTHAYRVLLYRAGAGLTLLGAVCSRGFRAALVLGGFYLALLVGFGGERTRALLTAVILEPAQGLPFPQTLAGWTIVACVAIYLTLLLARLLVFRLVTRQAVYLLLRLQIDRVPFENIDGYRPDDSAYDPTAQGFELVEVEEEIPAE